MTPGVILVYANVAAYAFCFQMQQPVQPMLLRELGVDESETSTIAGAMEAVHTPGAHQRRVRSHTSLAAGWVRH